MSANNSRCTSPQEGQTTASDIPAICRVRPSVVIGNLPLEHLTEGTVASEANDRRHAPLGACSESTGDINTSEKKVANGRHSGPLVCGSDSHVRVVDEAPVRDHAAPPIEMVGATGLARASVSFVATDTLHAAAGATVQL